ncbi:MAG TPA: MBL fold metallo-hydrolase [Capsulimonadaceae bacterium]|jgi:phosphoribosyl 1,2-cyclic phosphodiesterase
MCFSVHALASGSSGNSTLVRHYDGDREHVFLIDAGIAARTLNSHLAELGIDPASLAGIVLTHEHTDHSRAAGPFARKHGVPVIANDATLRRVFAGGTDGPTISLPTGSEWRVGSVCVTTFPVPHDAADPVGINVCGGGYKASLLTDLGSITPNLAEMVRGADLLICETNHDVHRLTTGPYPDLLKRRILSDRGHLSNEVAVKFMVEHLVHKGPCTFWLAHLSKVNNLPKLAINYARATLKLEAGVPFVLDVALRDRPSASWTPGRSPLQLSLFV